MHQFKQKSPRKFENDKKWRLSEFKAKIVNREGSLVYYTFNTELIETYPPYNTVNCMYTITNQYRVFPSQILQRYIFYLY